MVTLEFVPDDLALRLAADEDLAALHPLVVRLTLCTLSVRLQVGAVDLFGGPEPEFAGALLPVLDVAAWGLTQARLTITRGHGRYELPTHWAALRFVRAGSTVTVRHTELGTVGTAAADELLGAWEDFAQRVRRYVATQLPELAHNPFWGQWLSGSDFETLQPAALPTLGATRLEFTPDPAAVTASKGLGSYWQESPVGALMTALRVPVRLVVGGVQFVPDEVAEEDPEDDLLSRLPLLHLAAEGLAGLRAADRFGRGRYIVPGPPEEPLILWFERVGADGEEVVVWFNITGALAQVPYAELLGVWEQFVADVRAYVHRELPELADQPHIGEWLRGADYEDIPAFHPGEA